jgi:hypothetical protein
MIVHFNDFRKAYAKAKWWTVIYIIGIFGILTEWFMFFPSWYTRKIPLVKWLFWFWLDDSRFKSELSVDLYNKYSEDYYEFLDHRPETILTAYQWHMRNRVFNMQSLFRPKKGERNIVETIVDNLTMNGQKIDQGLTWIPMARLKYWDDGLEGPQVNSGAFISKKHSIFGKGYIWETIGNRLTFRYSFLKLIFGLWWNFVAGENDKRFALTLKIKKQKPIKSS